MHILEILTEKILDRFNLAATTIVAPKYRKREEILLYDLIYSIIAFPESVESAASNLDSSKTCVLKYIKDHIQEKPLREQWSVFLLKEVGFKYCNNCATYQELDRFSNDGTRKVGKCKDCVAEYQQMYHNLHPNARKEYYLANRDKILSRVIEYKKEHAEKYSNYIKEYYLKNKDSGIFREYAARRRSRKLHATPSWANLDIIKEIYRNAEGMHVDHIIPLQGELVCGLHVESNLQYLTPEENLAKGNKFIVE